jgi:hypothetical protein
MRVLARIGYTLAGLALLAPAVARAGVPAPTPPPKKKAVKSAPKKLCAGCQARHMMAQGKRVPPPPPLPPGVPVRGEQCPECGAATAVVVSGKVYRAQDLMAANAPGRAVAGGEAYFATHPGEPAPIGVMGPRVAGGMPARAPGTRDLSVMPTSMASDPISPPGHNRPHVLSHMLGLSELGRGHAEARARRKEEAHARIPYGVQPNSVQDVPASVVYGRR